MEKKYVIWHVQGGLGKNIAASSLTKDIKEIVDYPNLGRTGVRLEELSNPLVEMNGGMGEPTFNIFRFRELEIPPPMELEIREALDNDLGLETIEEDDGLLRRIRN